MSDQCWLTKAQPIPDHMDYAADHAPVVHAREWRVWWVDGHGCDVDRQPQINRSLVEPAAPHQLPPGIAAAAQCSPCRQ